jgi:hypothetical protein
MFDLMNLCIKGSMYEFFNINRNWICVSQLLKGGSFPGYTMDAMRDMVTETNNF